jgi:hypothetical protein
MPPTQLIKNPPDHGKNFLYYDYAPYALSLMLQPYIMLLDKLKFEKI